MFTVRFALLTTTVRVATLRRSAHELVFNIIYIIRIFGCVHESALGRKPGLSNYIVCVDNPNRIKRMAHSNSKHP